MGKDWKMNTAEDSEGASAVKPPPYPNFRRIARVNGSNASDTLKEDPVIRRFYVVVPQDYKEELKLPLQFCRDLGKKIPSDAILISYKGMWKTDIGRCSCHKDLVLSGNGWRSFIHHHDLEEDDFVWFEQTDLMVFRIHVFDLNDDGEKFALGNWQAEHSQNDLFDQVFTDCNFGSLHQHGFTANIEGFHLKKSYLTIPADFVRRNGDLNQKKRVILVNSGGHAWEVELCNSYDRRVPDHAQRNFKLRKGWPAFFKSNKLQIRDFVVFILDDRSRLSSPDNIVMNVRIRRTI